MRHIYSLETVRGSRIDLLHYFSGLQWNPVNTVNNGPKKLAVLTGDQINERLAGRRKNVALTTK